jgi:predicted DNA binding CopG/RHH family protein
MGEFDQEEKEILEAFHAGQLKPADDFEARVAAHRQYAEAVLRKDARINIRISSRDLQGLQSLALAEGIPYQTLVASILHKYVEGRLKEEKL